jgi:hypothetical protein
VITVSRNTHLHQADLHQTDPSSGGLWGSQGALLVDLDWSQDLRQLENRLAELKVPRETATR